MLVPSRACRPRPLVGGYVPAPLGQALIMRLPAIDGAASVRLTEPARHASAVASIVAEASR